MSDFVVHKDRRVSGKFARHYGAEVVEVRYMHGELTQVELSDGRRGAGSCLGCGSALCIEKELSELELSGSLDAFPGDPANDVCPTKAIKWDRRSSVVLISEDACIGCGLCISRCPYGAISLINGFTAYVQIEDFNNLIATGEVYGDHPKVKRSGMIATLDSSSAGNLPEKVSELDDGRVMLFVRNLLHEVGLKARTRRRGDTNMRIDAVGFSRDEKPFVAEIETGADVLESPRALLEDVAVLHSRYGYPVSDINLLSIILSFPNMRSEYYQVVRDIEKVLGLRCRTITIGALVALLWSFERNIGFEGDAFAIGERAISIADCLGLSRDLAEPYPGAFRPVK